MSHNTHQSSWRRPFHRQTSGIALVITLTMLAIVALLAIAFVMTARTELKSGSAYNDQVASKALAKMAVDRALMEYVRQGVDPILSGGSLNYQASDLTQLDNYTNDIGPASPSSIMGMNGDFVKLYQVETRFADEPYWIGVTNPATKMLAGRFAYMAYGHLVDINAIGNIAGPNDTYQRYGNFPGNPPLTGYIGVPSNGYTRGICSDINLAKFLEKLGYGGTGSTIDANESARRILLYRYGWNPTLAVPALGSRLYLPGIIGVDNNQDGLTNNPSEYTVTPATIGLNQAIGSLSQLDQMPLNSLHPIAPDPSNSNLVNYATTYSADSNITNAGGGVGCTLRAPINTNDVPTLINMLNCAGINHPYQVALNILDFHTANTYPTVTNISGVTYAGIKPTPYINQILYRFDTKFYRSTNVTGTAALKEKTNYWYNISVTVSNEIWNPYSGTFPDTNNLVVTNTVSIVTNAATGKATAPLVWSVSCAFTSPAPGFTINYSPFATNVYYNTTSAAGGFLNAGTYTSWPGQTNPVNLNPPDLVISNIFLKATLTGTNSVSPTNLIQIIVAPVTNLLAVSWPAVATWPYTCNPCTSAVSSSYISLEADDPRMSILYSQTIGGPSYAYGTMNTTAQPTSPPREGLASFYIKTNDYVTIGEVGYVHRGDPWTTIRLQPNGDGKILEYIRVNDLQDVAGRISMGSDVNGPLGKYQSPAFFALFSGLSNSYYTATAPSNTITDAKILSIIAEIDSLNNTSSTTSSATIGYDISGVGGSFQKFCNITAFNTDLAGTPIPYTDDAAREKIIRDIAPLTTFRSGGSATIIGWGQVIKGGNTLGVPVVIKASYSKVGGRIKLTSYQYYYYWQ